MLTRGVGRTSPTRKGLRMHHSERRSAARYVPVRDQVRLGWWDADRFRTVRARLLDISSGGAALLVDQSPPAPPSVWMCLVGQAPTEWIPATLAAGTTGEDGSQRIRLVFTGPC